VGLRDDQIRLFEKFAHFYDSGVPLAEALELARAGLADPVFEAVQQVVEDLYRGSHLADAMARRPDVFGADIVGIVRVGERRGELGTSARQVAAGLSGEILEPAAGADADLDELLERAGDGLRVIHLEPGRRLRLRTPDGLEDGGEADTPALIAALDRRAGFEGAFLWNDRLVRVAIVAGPAAVVRLSGVPVPEPPEAREWRTGRPGLLVVTGGRYADFDATLRGVLRAFDATATKRVAVGLPAPEALAVADLDEALSQDPDVVCVASVADPDDVLDLEAAVDAGIRVVAGTPAPGMFQSASCRFLRL